MNISFIIPWISKSRGGTEKVGSMMANAAVAHGHTVTVFTYDDSRGEPQWPLSPEIAFRYLPEKMSKKNELPCLLEVSQSAPDLIVALDMNRRFFNAVYIGYRLGVPVVVSEHADPKWTAIHQTFAPEERIAVFSGATRIHLLLNDLRRTLPDFLQERICVVPNGVEPAQSIADTKGSEDRRMTIIAVGRFVARKNTAGLVHAFSSLASRYANWDLRLVGYGPEERQLKELVDGLGLSERVIFTGKSNDPYEHYSEAQIFASASRAEVFPMNVLEAMAHGLPIVAFDGAVGRTQALVHGQSGMIFGDAEHQLSLTECLDSLMADASLRLRLGKSAHDRYNDHYHPDRISQQWMAMFEEALTAGPAAMNPSPEAVAQVRLKNLLQAGSGAL
ncbi:glycosyltransferase [Halovulum sp. GXIMD14794]